MSIQFTHQAGGFANSNVVNRPKREADSNKLHRTRGSCSGKEGTDSAKAIGYRDGTDRRESHQMIGHPGPELFVLLCFGHCLADFPLQTDKLAVGKCPGSQVAGVPWGYWLAGHAGTHALVVALLTGNTWLGLAEFIVHSIIDIVKCKGITNLAADQVLHLSCKALWVVILWKISTTT